jgi:hypothetical protein
MLASWCDRIITRPKPTAVRVFGAVLHGDCWCWTGWNNGKGHGRVKVDVRGVYLHRYSYEQFHSVSLLSSHAVDHLCRERSCFNPGHHEAVSFLENYERGDGPSYQFKKTDDATLSADDLDAMIRGF